MAILSDYTSGVISLAKGSVTVTGTGTMFKTVGLKAGATLLIQNLTAVIVSVDSNTKLTLAEPWTGTSLVNAPYRARFLPDGTTVTATTATLIEMLGNGNLEALAGLVGEMNKVPMFTGAGTLTLIDKSEFVTPDPNGNLVALAELASRADMLPYFTGAGTVGLTALTEFARTLLDDGDAAAARGTLGLTGNDIAKFSLENFGAYNPATSGVNIDNEAAGLRGLYQTSLQGAPSYVGVSFWWIETQATYLNSARYQIAKAYQGSIGGEPIIAVRISSSSGVWGAWRFLIAERGSNANGEFVKFPDGTLICKTNALSVTNFTAAGSIFRSPEVTWVFPVGFSGSPPAVTGVTTGSSSIWLTAAATGTQAVIRGNFTGALTTNWPLSVTAIGRWF